MTLETLQTAMRSAGKSQKGAGKFNWEYICCVEFPEGSGIKGLFAVADGSPSPARGDRASEMAVELLKDFFADFRSQPLPSDNLNLLKQCFAEINKTLINSNHREPEGGEETSQPLLTTLTAGYVQNNTLYVGHAGANILYLIDDGKIQRLTEIHPTEVAENPDEAENLTSVGVLGWDEKKLRADFFAVPIKGNSVFIFCTDGVISRLSNLTLVETWLEMRTPEAAVERLLERSEKRGAPTDASAVILQFATEEEIPSRFVGPIHYPAGAILKKYLLSAALLTLLTVLLLSSEPLLRLNIPGGAPVAEYKPQVKIESPPTPPVLPASEIVVSRIFVSVMPADARVLVNGTEVKGSSPFRISIPQGQAVKLRVERSGYIPHEETLTGEGGVSGSKLITLRQEKKEYGSLSLSCAGGCYALFLDGSRVQTTYPREELQIESLTVGRHTVRAEAGRFAQEKRVEIKAGRSAELNFEFPEAARAEAMKAERPSTAERSDSAAEQGKQVVRKDTAPAALPKPETGLKRAFFTVKTNIAGCTVMVFQNDQLVRTGFSGERMDVPPGRYIVKVMKDGHEPVVKEVELREKSSTLEFTIR
ncbi:MAG: protein phosphatase 2C domain-containing protein, partial [bacterium]